MDYRRPHSALAILAVATLVPTSGCVLAAAGAGAGGGIYFTTRGVESVVATSVDATLNATERAFEQLGIRRTSLKVEAEGARREIEGRSEDPEADVSVKLERADENTTRIEVSARRDLVTWDKDFAREIVEKVVELATGRGSAGRR